jgi:hypothetical protein
MAAASPSPVFCLLRWYVTTRSEGRARTRSRQLQALDIANALKKITNAVTQA